MENTFAKLASLISERFGCDENSISLKSDFRLDLGFDSLDEIELLMAVEDDFGIVIPDDELAGVSAVTDAVSLIEKLMGVPT